MSTGRDLNPRLYGFAGRSLGPLGHRCVISSSFYSSVSTTQVASTASTSRQKLKTSPRKKLKHTVDIQNAQTQSAQLKHFELLSGRPGSNRRPQPWQGCALPTELRPRISAMLVYYPMYSTPQHILHHGDTNSVILNLGTQINC